MTHASAGISLCVYDHFCELSPGFEPSLIDGHLLVVLLDDSALSDAFADYCERRIVRLSDKAEFQIAMVSSIDFPLLDRRASDLPAIFHFACGVENERSFGVDDCMEFLREFILNNQRQ